MFSLIFLVFIFVFGCESKSEFAEIYRCSDGYDSQARIMIISPQEKYLFNHFLLNPKGRLLKNERFHLEKTSNHIVTVTGMLRGGVSHPNSEIEEPLCLTIMETPQVRDPLDIINVAEEVNKKSFQLIIIAVAPVRGKSPISSLETELLVSELMLIDSLYEESIWDRTRFVFVGDNRLDTIQEEELNQWAINVQGSVWNISSTDLENYQVPWITEHTEAGSVLSIDLNMESCYRWTQKETNFFSNEKVVWIGPPSSITIPQKGVAVNFKCFFKADKFDPSEAMVQSSANEIWTDEDVHLTHTHEMGDLYTVNVKMDNPDVDQRYWCSIDGANATNSMKIIIDGKKQATWSEWSPWQPCENLNTSTTRNRNDTSNSNGISLKSSETQERPCRCSDLAKFPEPRILLLGKTGVGKSTLGNKLFGGYEVFAVGKDDEAKTDHTSSAMAPIIGGQECVTIIDTPGMKNIKGKDYQHSLNMIEFLKNDVETFNVILVLVKGGSIDEGTIEVLKWYEALFGTKMWNHVIIEVTFWPHTQRSSKLRWFNGKVNEESTKKNIRRKLVTELQVPRHIIVPVVFIDPMAQISQDICEVDFTSVENDEITQFSKYMTELKEFLRSAPVYNCSDDCMNPDAFFQGAPIVSYPTDGVLYIRPGEEKSIEWQIWTGMISSKGSSYIVKLDNATIYKNANGAIISEADESFESSTGFSTLIEEITKVPKMTSVSMAIALNKDHIVENYSSLVMLENGIDPPSPVKILIAKDATLGQWSNWSGCSVSCVHEGSTMPGSEVRTRICSPEENRGRPCSELLGNPSIAPNSTGTETITRECFGPINSAVTLCPIGVTWSSWTEWGPCPVTCGQGYQVRSRMCINGRHGGKLCSDKFSHERRSCLLNQTCPLYCNLGDWSIWSSCSATCWKQNSQVPSRQRSKPILREGNSIGISCDKLFSLETVNCNVHLCPVNGNWGAWTDSSQCSLTCGSGAKIQTRACDNPHPAHGGEKCQGSASQTIFCNTQYCPINGNWGTWTDSSQCPITCGIGVKIQTRACNNPHPAHGGEKCQGSASQSISCNSQHCPINGNWGAWTDLAQCSLPCGVGSKTQTRECNNPHPSNGGRTCEGSASQTVSCNTHICPETSSPQLSGVRFRNQLPQDIYNVRVQFAVGNKGTGVWAYTFNWAQVDIESQYNVISVVDVNIGHVRLDEAKIVNQDIPFKNGYRGYWQVYFRYDGRNYKINKNNAQANPWDMDKFQLVEITLIKEYDYIRVEITFKSGRAYFYCMSV